MPPARRSSRAGRACSAVEPIQPSSRSCPTRSSSVVSALIACATAWSSGELGVVGDPAVPGDGDVTPDDPVAGAVGAGWLAPGAAGAAASALGAGAGALPLGGTSGGSGLKIG